MTTKTYTAFLGQRIAARGTEADISAALTGHGPHPDGLLVFDDTDGSQVDFNLTGTPVQARPPKGARPGSGRPGRPKLGVKSREVTLLPRHWDWLARQRGGASATLRRLVDAAATADTKPSPDAAYRFLTAIAGDLAGYEAAIRALYAADTDSFVASMTGWPDDIRSHALALGGL